jgi:outer membrane protein assembly factor BamB
MRPLALVALFVAANAGATNWPQFGFDAQHSAYNPAERGYATANGQTIFINGAAIPANVDQAPIFVEHVATPSGLRDLLFGVTVDGALLAIDASNGAIVWSAQPTGAGTLTQSTPATDLQFVYAYGFDGKVHKYRISDGAETLDDGWPQTVTLKPQFDKVAAGLTLATSPNGARHLYVVTNSYYDQKDFQGHLTTIDLDAGTQHLFNAQCSDFTSYFVANGITQGAGQNDCPAIASGLMGETANSGIWGRGGATYDARTDRVYIATGNGAFDPTNAQALGRDWGDSVLAFNADGSTTNGTPLDSYTPSSYPALLQNDADLGSMSPVVLPTPPASTRPHLGMQSGKDGCMRLLDFGNLSGTGGTGAIGGDLQAMPLPGVPNHCVDGGNVSESKFSPAVWIDPSTESTWLEVAHQTGFVAYELVVDGAGKASLSARWSTSANGTSPVVANGIVYYVNSAIVRAVDARTGELIWTDTHLGRVHWESPIVVNGRLYVFDEFSHLWAYRLDGVFRGGFE